MNTGHIFSCYKQKLNLLNLGNELSSTLQPIFKVDKKLLKRRISPFLEVCFEKL